MAFLSGRFVRQTIVDAFRPDSLFATARTRAGTRLSTCVPQHRDDSYPRGASQRYFRTVLRSMPSLRAISLTLRPC